MNGDADKTGPMTARWWMILLLARVCSAQLAEPVQNGGKEWPTLHGDVQRSGFHPQFPRGKLELVWRHQLWRELTGPRAEVIVGAGLAFLGTYAGRMVAWDAETGKQRWAVQTGGPIGHSPAIDRQVLFFGSMDRRFRALDAATGHEIWSFAAHEGIWTAPCVWRNRVFFGARDGTFYALDCATGERAWDFRTGGPILTTASISEDGSSVVFASEDLHLYCLEVDTGRLRWKSRKLAGLSVRDYAPLISGGLAIVTTNPVKDFHTILDQHQTMLVKRTGSSPKDPRFIAGTAEDVAREQEFVVDFLRAHPEEQTFYAFRVTDGIEPWIAPILYTGGLHNPPSPPCVNRATGDVFVQLRSAYGTWDGGGEVRPFTCFGRLDLKTGRVPLLDHAYPSKEGGRPPGAKDMPWMTFNYIGDETQTLSTAPGLLINTHQGFIGVFDLTSRMARSVYGKRDTYGGFYGAGNFGWESQGGFEKAAGAGEPYGVVNEWHGPARAMVSTANGKVYFAVGAQVLCLGGGAE